MRYQVYTDGLTTTHILSRRYAVVDTQGVYDEFGRPLSWMLQTDDARRAAEYAYELNSDKRAN